MQFLFFYWNLYFHFSTQVIVAVIFCNTLNSFSLKEKCCLDYSNNYNERSVRLRKIILDFNIVSTNYFENRCNELHKCI